MPAYDMICDECKTEEEINCSYDKMKDHKCVKCGNETRQDFKQFNFILKGGGWHKTDYPTEKNKMDKLKYVSSD